MAPSPPAPPSRSRRSTEASCCVACQPAVVVHVRASCCGGELESKRSLLVFNATLMKHDRCCGFSCGLSLSAVSAF
jgi:hypothetical protein